MVVILRALSASIPLGVTWEGSALRKRRSERVVEVGLEVGYLPMQRKLWIPSIGMKGGEGRDAIIGKERRKSSKVFMYYTIWSLSATSSNPCTRMSFRPGHFQI